MYVEFKKTDAQKNLDWIVSECKMIMNMKNEKKMLLENEERKLGNKYNVRAQLSDKTGSSSLHWKLYRMKFKQSK